MKVARGRLESLKSEKDQVKGSRGTAVYIREPEIVWWCS